MILQCQTLEETKGFARTVGERLTGGEVFELRGDVGSGKTAFTKGLAEGLGVNDDVQSPSFTISRTYPARDGLELHHYDFYRLEDPGIMTYELSESLHDDRTVTVIEWAETVAGVLPAQRVVISFVYGAGETERVLTIEPETTAIQEAYAAWHKN